MVVTFSLYLNLREAAYRTNVSTHEFSELTGTLSEWIPNRQSTTMTTLNKANTSPKLNGDEWRFIGQDTLQGMMGFNDFGMELTETSNNRVGEEIIPWINENSIRFSNNR